MKDLSILVNGRIQSSRVEQKMIRPFGETTLLRLSLEKLNQLTFAKHRFFCIAEKELLKYAEGLENIEILWRKKEAVAKGDVGSICFEHYYRIPTPWFMFMNASHPFVTVETYHKAHEVFLNSNYNSYTSVTKRKAWIFDFDGNPLTNKDPNVVGTKQGNYCFEANHAFHIINKEYFMKTGYQHWDMKKGSPYLIEIPESEVLDIDTQLDFDKCDLLYRDGYPKKKETFNNSEKDRFQNKKDNFVIGRHNLNQSNRTLIIAEVACAHDGSLGMAHKYIDIAAEIGVDVIKFQTHIAQAESTLDEPFRVDFSRQDKTRMDYWKRMEFKEEEWLGLKRHAEEKGLVFMSSPFSNEAVDLLMRIGVEAWKVGSGEITNDLILRHIGNTGLPVIISTGMSFWREIDQATNLLNEMKVPYAVMQCTSLYPTSPEKVGLNIISDLRERYNVPVGLSSHSPRTSACLAAVCNGAQIIEFHLTLSEHMFGPDVDSSLTPEKAKEMVEQIRDIEIIKNTDFDKDTFAYDMKLLRKTFLKSLVLNEDVLKGMLVSFDIFSAKKPCIGIPANEVGSIIGKKFNRDMKKNEFVHMRDIV